MEILNLQGNTQNCTMCRKSQILKSLAEALLKVFEGSANILIVKPTQIWWIVSKMTQNVKLHVKKWQFLEKNEKQNKIFFWISALTNNFPRTIGDWPDFANPEDRKPSKIE